MKTILVISDSVEGSEYDLKRSILTIKDSNMDPMSVVPTIYEYGGNAIVNESEDVLEYVFGGNCDTEVICVGYLTQDSVVTSVSSKIKAIPEEKKKPVICAPSLISSAGEILVSEDVYYSMCDNLLPLADIMVVNSFEAELLCEFECPTKNDYQRAARKISTTYGCAVLVKSCDKTEGKNLLFNGSSLWLEDPVHIPEGSELKYNLMTSIACCYAQTSNIVGAVRNGIKFYASGLTAKEHIEIQLTEGKSRVTEYGTDDSVEVVPAADSLAEEIIAATKKEEMPLDEFVATIEKADEVAPAEEPVVEEVHVELPTPTPERKPYVRPSLSATPVPSFGSGSVLGRKIETASPTTTASSLVSPVKNIRDIARKFELEHMEPETVVPAVTSTIEKPAPGPKAPVSDLKPAAPSDKGVLDLQSLKDRLNKLAGSGNN